MSVLYDREREAADLLRDLIALRVRLDRLMRNLDGVSHDAKATRKRLDLAISSMARVRPGPQCRGETS